MSWFSSKKLCSHCNVNKTYQKFEGAITCPQCESKIVASRETIRRCPVDQTEMVKENHSGIILDRCNHCKGVWLDCDELEAMQELAKKDSDLVTGMVIGMAIG
jgi:Zn-finger nucleic acid-binding protein